MAVWEIRFLEGVNEAGVGAYTGRYAANNLTFEILNSTDGGFTCEIPLSATQLPGDILPIGRDSFAPKRSTWELWRDSKHIGSGFVTSVNLNKDRDTILVAGRDWIWYLKQRIYPFNPVDFVTYNATSDGTKAMYATSNNPGNPSGIGNWPKRWPTMAIGDQNPIDTFYIVRDLMRSMRVGYPVDYGSTWYSNSLTRGAGVPDIIFTGRLTGQLTKYKIYPGDSTTIYDHIKKMADRTDGFEFDILPGSLEFKMYVPRRDNLTGFPEYILKVASVTDFDPNIAFPNTILEGYGQFIEFDWTNDGPDGTYLIGLGQRGKKVGQVWTDEDNVRQFSRLDLVYDFGELSNTDNLLQMLKDQNDLHPQKKLALRLLNPEFLVPNFYQGSRPRSLMGQRVRVIHDFAPYHKVNADFRINQISINVDNSTNEEVDLGLEMVYEP